MAIAEEQVTLLDAATQALQEWNKVPETAAYLNLSDKAVWQFIASGRLGVARFGRAVRISRAEIQRFITEGTAPAQRAS